MPKSLSSSMFLARTKPYTLILQDFNFLLNASLKLEAHQIKPASLIAPRAMKIFITDTYTNPSIYAS